ncbi:MAG: hypothetical protein ACI90V_012145 [Bacillariaceae sp.]|jgi:hypothetical protein
MSGQDESANSRFLGHSLRKSKDAQFDEEGHRPPLLSPKKIHGLSDDDDENFSFSNTSTAYVVFLIPVVCMHVTTHTLLVAISY